MTLLRLVLKCLHLLLELAFILYKTTWYYCILILSFFQKRDSILITFKLSETLDNPWKFLSERNLPSDSSLRVSFSVVELTHLKYFQRRRIF